MDLKELREAAGLIIIDVAYHIGVAESTVRNWEKGRTIPRLTPEQLDKICHLYNCSYTDWMQAYKETRKNTNK
ncbi:MAG: helix-turn-helix transcriptional regulator [Nostoc sp.]|uniref:helix-turn-helix domain-containing protein n=1 Tax=Nostoc sp. TaxID=1180 RepID=UPI002FF523BF